jgi:hypothetical protein
LARATSRGPSGWAAFAGVILFVVGSFNVIYGLAAGLNDAVITVGGEGAIIWDIEAWGWIHFGLGILLIATAIGLFLVETWARVVAVILAALQALAQVVLITAFPLFSILIIILDVAVIYNLTVKHGEAAYPARGR